MRAAAEITAKTFDYVLENIKVGMTEQQVVGPALGKMHELGAERESYPLWVLTGNGTMEGEAPWIETSADYLLEENMTFCLDIFLGSAEKEIGLRMEDVVNNQTKRSFTRGSVFLFV